MNGVAHNYILNGSQVVAEQWGNNLLLYLYDENGAPIGLGYRTTEYAEGEYDYFFFDKNIFGDVTAIYNEQGECIGTYTYDAWGQAVVTQVTGNTALETLILTTYNPFRYRGYYYDQETGLYYLQSRYYNPEWGRFISPDHTDVLTATPMALTDKNLYAYCDNNPITRADGDGEFWHIIIGAAVGVATQYISDVVTNVMSGEKGWDALKIQSTWADYAGAALSGALAASGAGVAVSALANAAIDGMVYVVNNGISGTEIDASKLIATMVVGAVTSGKGIDGKNLRGIYKHSKQALATAVSPKKIAMYTSKITQVNKEVARKIGSSLIEGAISGGISYLNERCRTLYRW